VALFFLMIGCRPITLKRIRNGPGRSPVSESGAAMSVFEFVFTFFGLVLGFAVAEILAGFARALNWSAPTSRCASAG